MSEHWIRPEAFENALQLLSEEKLNANCVALLGLKIAGVNTSTWTVLRSTEDWKANSLELFTVRDSEHKKVGIFNPFTGNLYSKGDYAHGTLYSPLREKRKDFGKYGLIWERDEVGLKSDDTTNYKVKFAPDYINVAQEAWMKHGAKIPLRALAVYLQAKCGVWNGKPSVSELENYWQSKLSINSDELTSWFSEDESIDDIFSEESWTIEEVDERLGKSFVKQAGAASVPSGSSNAFNLLVYGAPGCGKSTLVEKLCEAGTVIRCVFYSDISRSDFVGSVRPVSTRNADGSWDSIFRFVPGPFVRAFEKAKNNMNEQIYLVIEEINRADAAAAFGELFQLLDRDENGESRFSIDTPSDVRQYLKDERNLDIETIRLPKNLRFIATMNVADESLRPLDAAFRRRWDWTEVEPLFYSDKLKSVVIEDEGSMRWIDFVADLNTRILNSRPGDDYRVGAFFVLPQNSVISRKQISERLFPYLWSDVHRHAAVPLFRSTFDSLVEVQTAYQSEGLAGVFDWIQDEPDSNQ